MKTMPVKSCFTRNNQTNSQKKSPPYSGFGKSGSGEMIRSYTTEVSLLGLPIDDASGGRGDTEHLGGGGGGRYEGLGGLGTFPGVC